MTRKNKLNSLVGPTVSPGLEVLVAGVAIAPPQGSPNAMRVERSGTMHQIRTAFRVVDHTTAALTRHG